MSRICAITGSKPTRGSPELIAACYVLHRLSVPRHPPNALVMLDPYQKPDLFGVSREFIDKDKPIGSIYVMALSLNV